MGNKKADLSSFLTVKYNRFVYIDATAIKYQVAGISIEILFSTFCATYIYSECVALQDPYCAWDKVQGKCRSHGSGRWGEESYFFQSVATGQHTACPPPKLGKDAGPVGGLSSTQPKFNQDHQPSKDQPDGQVINIVQEKTYESSGECFNF